MKKAILSIKGIIVLMLLAMSANAQIWSAEFNQTGVPGADSWTMVHANGGFGNNELQFYTNRSSNVWCSGGNLQLTARRESFGGNAYTSGKITTQGKRQFTYGWIEGRMQIPMGKGLWPAFWMLGANIGSVGWPACGEIDIMEHINSEANTYGTIHWQGPSGYAYYGGSRAHSPQNWHNYQINWNNLSIRWYVDGVQFWAANIANNINSTEEFHRAFFFNLNLAVGGNWPGSPNSSTPFPAVFRVDYVRVYAANPGAKVSVDEELAQAEELSAEEISAAGGIYPNPAVRGESLTIKIKNYDSKALVNVDIFDMKGKNVFNTTKNHGSVTISTENMKDQLYIVKVTNGERHYVQKLIIK